MKQNWTVTLRVKRPSIGSLALACLTALGIGAAPTAVAQSNSNFLSGTEHAKYTQYSKQYLTPPQMRALQRFRSQALYHAAFYFVPGTGVSAWYTTMHSPSDARRAAERLCVEHSSLASHQSGRNKRGRGANTLGGGKKCQLYAEIAPISLGIFDTRERRLSAVAEEARDDIRANTRLGNFGAIAISPSGIFGSTWDYTLRQEAIAEAMAQCNLGVLEEQFEMDYLRAKALADDGWFTCNIAFLHPEKVNHAPKIPDVNLDRLIEGRVSLSPLVPKSTPLPIEPGPQSGSLLAGGEIRPMVRPTSE